MAAVKPIANRLGDDMLLLMANEQSGDGAPNSIPSCTHSPVPRLHCAV